MTEYNHLTDPLRVRYEREVRHQIVGNLSVLIGRRIARRKGGRRTQIDDAIAAVARGIADGTY